MGARREEDDALGGKQRPRHVVGGGHKHFQHLVVEHGGAEDTAATLRPVDILRKDDARPVIRTRHYAGERGLERHVASERRASCDVQRDADAEGDDQEDDEGAEEEARLRGRGGVDRLNLELLHFLAGGAAESGAGHGGNVGNVARVTLGKSGGKIGRGSATKDLEQHWSRGTGST